MRAWRVGWGGWWGGPGPLPPPAPGAACPHADEPAASCSGLHGSMPGTQNAEYRPPSPAHPPAHPPTCPSTALTPRPTPHPPPQPGMPPPSGGLFQLPASQALAPPTASIFSPLSPDVLQEFSLPTAFKQPPAPSTAAALNLPGAGLLHTATKTAGTAARQRDNAGGEWRGYEGGGCFLCVCGGGGGGL
jgi:hypothetical protein